MAYRVLVSGPARRALEHGLPIAVAAAAFEFLHGALAEDPLRVGKPLRGQLAGRWSARRGEYRVIYAVDRGTQTVTVLRIAHRRDAYR